MQYIAKHVATINMDQMAHSPVVYSGPQAIYYWALSYIFNKYSLVKTQPHYTSTTIWKSEVFYVVDHCNHAGMINVSSINITIRNGPLLGPNSSSCGELRPKLVWPFGQNKSLLCCLGKF